MVSHKNYNLNVNEDFVIFLTSKLITYFIDGFTWNEIPINFIFLLIGSTHIYWILDLKIKYTPYAICNQATFKNTRAIFFSTLERNGQQFSVGFKNSPGDYPSPDWTPPIVHRRDSCPPSQTNSVHHILGESGLVEGKVMNKDWSTLV